MCSSDLAETQVLPKTVPPEIEGLLTHVVPQTHVAVKFILLIVVPETKGARTHEVAQTIGDCILVVPQVIGEVEHVLPQTIGD